MSVSQETITPGMDEQVGAVYRKSWDAAKPRDRRRALALFNDLKRLANGRKFRMRFLSELSAEANHPMPPEHVLAFIRLADSDGWERFHGLAMLAHAFPRH